MSERDRVLTLLFTDLADSTALKSERGDQAAGEVLSRHRDQLHSLANKTGGRVISWAGDGCLLTFETASSAVLFALRLQQAHFADADLPAVRIGVHMGEVTEISRPDHPVDVHGLAVDLAARVASLAAPRQILLSSAVFNSVRQRLRGDEVGATIAWRAHGEYELKGVDEPVSICEAGIEDVSPLTPPPASEKAHRAVSPNEEETLGWRPAVGLAVPRRQHWILEQQLGEGGFGEVWLALHEKTRAKRVFKFCFEVDRVRGLKREVVLFRLLKESLGHRDDIAQIIDWEFERPPYFLESEYTEGGDLRDWAAAKGGLDKIPLKTRLEMVSQVAVALGAAHSVGVLHKDIKPGNILVREVPGVDTPRTSLTDFGIGLITDPAALAAQGITAAGLTETLGRTSSSTSSGAGTRVYMAPELLEGKRATTLSDIYALGVLLYQIVSGDLSRAVAPGWERDVPDELLREDIGLCLDGDPTRRLKSADELAKRLRGLDERRNALDERRQLEQQVV
ncbi:MAG: protein kinase, partial [Candidatus Hydrogenedentales bacterium]